MVMRKNMKKVAILTLAFGFLSSLGNVGAIIKKEGSVTPSSEISMITTMMMGFPVRVPVPVPVPGPVHGPVPVHGHAPVPVPVPDPGPVPVHGPDFCLPRPSNSIYNREPNNVRQLEGKDKEQFYKDIEKLAREFAKVFKNYLYKHYKKR